MRHALWPLLCLVTLLGISVALAQQTDPAISPLVSNTLTRIIRTDRTVTAGLFVSLHQDSVCLLVGGVLQNFARNQILRLSIERRTETGKATLGGMLLGLYAGNLVFFRGENQPFAYRQSRESDGILLDILANAAFGFAGAGIGYLVGSSGGGEQGFDFTKSGEDNQQEWERLRAFVSETDNTPNVHLSFQGSWVDTYLPDAGRNYYSSTGAANLNMMRKIQLTVTCTQFVDAGLAIMWLGQPLSGWSSYSPGAWASGLVEMTGHGYYAVGILKPLYSVHLRNLQWDIGAGLGLATVDYRGGNFYSPSLTPPTVSIKKTVFSGLICTEVKVFLSGYFSLGLAGDYVFIPEKVPAIPEVNVTSRSMGTTSIGFVLGLHF